MLLWIQDFRELGGSIRGIQALAEQLRVFLMSQINTRDLHFNLRNAHLRFQQQDGRWAVQNELLTELSIWYLEKAALRIH